MQIKIEGFTSKGVSKGRIFGTLRAEDDLEQRIDERKKQIKVGPGGRWEIEIDDGDTQMARVDTQRVGFREGAIGDYETINGPD